jgi:hypothetical protein
MGMSETHFPMTATQLAGHGVTSVVSGLQAPSPWMLGVVILNILGIGAAVYFLNILITGQQGHLKQVLEVQQSELATIMMMHNREFDALLQMNKDIQGKLVIPPPPEPEFPFRPDPGGSP